MTIDCPHWSECGVTGGGCCAIAKYVRPSFGTCRRCLGLPVVTLKPPTVSKEARGRALWGELHRYAYATPEAAAAWLPMWLARVPCGECKKHAKEIVEAMPADFTSADAFFVWGVGLHNAVNRMLGKREWTVEEARAAMADS